MVPFLDLVKVYCEGYLVALNQERVFDVQDSVTLFLSFEVVVPYQDVGIFTCFLCQDKASELGKYIPLGYGGEGFEIT